MLLGLHCNVENNWMIPNDYLYKSIKLHVT